MSTLAPSANSLAAGAAVPEGAARLGLIDSGGASLANLAEAPQTIGSGPRCSVRLGGRGLRPLHCVITPGKNGPIVRRWAAETRLNGQEFTEAALSAGDLLRIGSIDLRVIELASDRPESPLPEPPSQGADAAPSENSSADFEPALPPLAGSEWLDESFDELVAAVDSVSDAPPAIDRGPATPSRLLLTWEPACPSAADSAGDPPLEAIAQGGSLDGMAADVDPLASVSEMAASIAESPSMATAADETALLIAEEAAPALVAAADYSAAFDEIVADTTELGPYHLATGAGLAAAERLRTIASVRRARVLQLVGALRSERRRTADLAEAVSGLASQLEQALTASDEAALELARLAEQRAEADDDRLAAREALEEATRRAEQLEAHVADLLNQVAELEANLAALVTAPESAETDPIPEEFAPAIEGASEDLPEAESPSPWTHDADAVPVFADEVLDGAYEAGEEVPVHYPAEDACESAEGVDEPLWGIERLAAAEEPSIEGSLGASTPTESDFTGYPPEDRHGAELVDEAAPYGDAAPVVQQDEPETRFESPSTLDEDIDRIKALLESDRTASEGESASSLAAAYAFPADGQEESADAPRPEPQASFIERFADLMPNENEPVERPAPVADAPRAASPSDDESIDDYMRKLLQRMRGGSAEEATLEAIAGAPGEVTAKSALAAESASLPAKVEMLRDLSEIRRNPSPEVATDMGALRQLANQSARHALDVAHSRQSREKATMRLTVSVVSVVAGALSSIYAPSPLDLQFIGGFTSVVVGGWFFVRTVRQCQVRTLDEQIALAAKHAG